MSPSDRLLFHHPAGVAPPSALRDPPLRTAASAEEALTATGPTGGFVVVHPRTPTGELLALLRGIADTGTPWKVVLLDLAGEPTGEVGWPVSLGYVTAIHALPAADREGTSPVLELRSVLKELSKARHDINNPLTSALAEAQLLLMDEPGGETQESLLQIQAQLRRIRDLVSELSKLRAPDS